MNDSHSKFLTFFNQNGCLYPFEEYVDDGPEYETRPVLIEHRIVQWILQYREMVSLEVEHCNVLITTDSSIASFTGNYVWHEPNVELLQPMAAMIESCLAPLGFYISCKYAKDSINIFVYFG